MRCGQATPHFADKVCKMKQTERNEAVFEEKRALA
jgi:hypothetical protein